MHQTISERWNRISLRTKITGVTVLMLTLGLLVSGIGTAAMLRSYVEDQMASKLDTIAAGSLDKYFEGQNMPGAKANLDDLSFASSDDVFVAIYDPITAKLYDHNWEQRGSGSYPEIPSSLTVAEVNVTNERSQSGKYTVYQLEDESGQPTFRAVSALMTADQHGTYEVQAGGKIALTYADGSVKVETFAVDTKNGAPDPNGEVVMQNLARGTYRVSATGQAYAVDQELALSRSQFVDLNVLTHVDASIAAGVALAGVVGLLWVGAVRTRRHRRAVHKAAVTAAAPARAPDAPAATESGEGTVAPVDAGGHP